MSEFLETSENAMTFGQRILLDVVPYPTSLGLPTLYRNIVAASFQHESHGQPVTVFISEARPAAEIEATAGSDVNYGITSYTGEYPHSVPVYGPVGSATYPIDWTLRDIRAVVEIARGGASYVIECDPGCCFTVPASAVSVKARIDFNTIPRYMSASITRGSVARAHQLSAPRLTAPPVLSRYVPRADRATDPGAYAGAQIGSNRVRIPPFARSFRAASQRGAVVSVVPVARKGELGGPAYWLVGQEQRPVAGRIWCSSWEDMHPVPQHANNLYVMSAIDQDVVFVEFQLGF